MKACCTEDRNRTNRLASSTVGLLFLCLAASPSVACAAVSTGVIAEGSRWETPYYINDSGVDGPTVLVTGGVHGNEPAGYRAAEQIRHWPIVKGRLIVIPRANIPGLLAKTRYLPDVAVAARDLNRDFIMTDDGELATEGLLATDLWGFAVQQKPDWVIDLHEGYEFHISHRPAKGKKRSVGSTIIYRASARLDPLVKQALTAANQHVTDPDREFVPLKRGPVSGSFARAAALKLTAQSMILETTSKNQPLSLRTRQHRAMMNSLLNDIGLLDRDCSQILSPGTQAKALQVAFFDGPGTGSGGKTHIPRIADAATQINIHYVGPEDIQPHTLDQFDLVVFPGGSGSQQAKALGAARRETVRQFVQQGGGYIGVCAGAYLCSANYSWSLNLIDSRVFAGTRNIEGVGRKSMWYRGKSTKVALELTAAGRQMFNTLPPKFQVTYHNGPIISPGSLPEIEDYTPLAWFRSEQVLYEPQRGTMMNTPAIVRGRFGKGRVISISPHPEADKALESIIVNSIQWVADHN